MIQRILWGGLAVILVGCASALSGGSAPPEPPSESSADQPEPKADVPQGDIEEPTVLAPQIQLQLEDLGPAPELNNEVWLNTDGPLRLADLRGQVVLLDMWTFG